MTTPPSRQIRATLFHRRGWVPGTTPSRQAAVSARRVTWKDRLRPVADALAEAHRVAQKIASDASEKELDALVQACRKPTQTNCWWATYDAGPVLLEACLHERRQRNRARAERRRATAGNAPGGQS